VSDVERNSDFAMYPNPAKSQLTIDGGTTSQLQKIEIYTILGEKVEEINQQEKSKSINIALNYSPGIYLVKINDTNTKKLIIN